MLTMQARDRLIVAADLSSRDEILALADELHDVIGLLKIGLQAFVANGPAIVREVVDRDVRVFLDPVGHPFCLFRREPESPTEL